MLLCVEYLLFQLLCHHNFIYKMYSEDSKIFILIRNKTDFSITIVCSRYITHIRMVMALPQAGANQVNKCYHLRLHETDIF